MCSFKWKAVNLPFNPGRRRERPGNELVDRKIYLRCVLRSGQRLAFVNFSLFSIAHCSTLVAPFTNSSATHTSGPCFCRHS